MVFLANANNLVDLDEMKRFISVVDCDALAIGIGNAHGIYKGITTLTLRSFDAYLCVVRFDAYKASQKQTSLLSNYSQTASPFGSVSVTVKANGV